MEATPYAIGRFRGVRRLLSRPVPPGAVRAIEYEIVHRVDNPLVAGGDPIIGASGATSPVAVLCCVDHRGAKVTVVGSAEHFQILLDSGAASNPSGMTLPREASLS